MLTFEGRRNNRRVKYHDDSAREAAIAEMNFQHLRRLRETGRRFQDVSARVLRTESRLALPGRPIDVRLGSSSALCADSPLAGF